MTVDLSKLSFSSGSRYERIALKGHTTFSVAGGGFANTTVTVTHGLGYVPYIKGFYTYGDGKFFQIFSGTASYNVDSNGSQISNVTVTASDYIIFIENFGVPAVSGTIYYRIYAEPQV